MSYLLGSNENMFTIIAIKIKSDKILGIYHMFLRMTQQSTVGRFITDVRCTEHNANLEIGNGTKWRV